MADARYYTASYGCFGVISQHRQLAVALNLIKVIIEHNIQDNRYENVEDIISAVEDGRIQRGHSRWYDIDRTVRAAINMLQNSPEQTQKIIAKEMAKLVIDKIKEDKDVEELKRELEQEEFFNDSNDQL